jgi:hypothetical protein
VDKGNENGTRPPLNSLNKPESIYVKEKPGGEPAVIIDQPPKTVASIEDSWRVDDEWWRKDPVSRMYYRVLLAGGQQLTVFKDLISGSWYRQQY